MSSSKTENLNLHAWTPDDPVKMSEFNENFAILDRAARIVTGSYVGNGAYGESSPTTLTLDFAPKVVFLFRDSYYAASTSYNSIAQVGYWGPEFVVLLAGATYVRVYYNTGTTYPTYTKVTFTEHGVSFWSGTNAESQWNVNNSTYHYVALG